MDTQTAEEENESNNLEENTKALLVNVVHKQQQSYENFVSNFTYLTQDDIEKREENKLSKQYKMSGNSRSSPSMTPDHLNNTSSSTNREKSEKLPNITNEDGLEEEILGEDIKINIGEEEESNKSKKNFTKFDNFVDNEDNDNSDNGDDDISDIGSGYLASFHESDLKAGSKNSDQSKEQTQKESANKIGNENSVPQRPSDCDIKIIECPFQPDENGFLLNPGEAEREVTPTDLSSIQHTTYLEYSCKYAPSMEKTAESNEKTAESNENIADSVEKTESVEKTADSVKKTADSVEKTSESVEKTADSVKKTVDSVEKTSESVDKTAEETTLPCTDEVEEFKLDDSFDYDNIVLTPKYTQQEMDYLNSFREKAEKSS